LEHFLTEIKLFAGLLRVAKRVWNGMKYSGLVDY